MSLNVSQLINQYVDEQKKNLVKLKNRDKNTNETSYSITYMDSHGSMKEIVLGHIDVVDFDQKRNMVKIKFDRETIYTEKDSVNMRVETRGSKKGVDNIPAFFQVKSEDTISNRDKTRRTRSVSRSESRSKSNSSGGAKRRKTQRRSRK